MNDTDRYVQRAIEFYFDMHSKYPERVEVADELRCQMTQRCFYFADMASIFTIDFVPTSEPMKSIEVPVTAVGDDVSRSFFIRQVDINSEDAQRMTEFHYGKLQHTLKAKNISTHIVDKITRKDPYEEKRYMCNVYGVAYGYQDILEELKEIIKG